MPTTYIDILRHGEPDGGRRFRGSSIDDALSDTGWKQMWAAIPEQADWDIIISSPLARCSGFASALSENLNIPLQIHDNLKEIGFGTWEGRTPEDVQENDGSAYQDFYADPVNNRPEGAEALDTFSERIWAAYNEIRSEHTDKKVLIVAHAGVIRAIAANILSMSLDRVYSQLKVEYASMIHTKIENDKEAQLLITGPKV